MANKFRINITQKRIDLAEKRVWGSETYLASTNCPIAQGLRALFPNATSVSACQYHVHVRETPTSPLRKFWPTSFPRVQQLVTDFDQQKHVKPTTFTYEEVATITEGL